MIVSQITKIALEMFKLSVFKEKKKGKKKEKKKGKNTETSHYPGKALLPARLSHQATTQMMFH